MNKTELNCSTFIPIANNKLESMLISERGESETCENANRSYWFDCSLYDRSVLVSCFRLLPPFSSPTQPSPQ